MNLIVKAQYFSLLKKLNKSNKLKNEKTNLIFLVEENNDKLQICASIGENQKIIVAECGIGKMSAYWQPTNFTGFEELEIFIANLMKNYTNNCSTIDIDELINCRCMR